MPQHPKYGFDAYDMARYIKGLTQQAAAEERPAILQHLVDQGMDSMGLKRMLKDKAAGRDPAFPKWYGPTFA